MRSRRAKWAGQEIRGLAFRLQVQERQAPKGAIGVRIPEHDALLFFAMQARLIVFLDRRQGGALGLESPEDLQRVPTAESAKLRRTLWDDPSLLEGYVSTNPDGWPEDVLAVIATWQWGFHGEFIVERHLKRYSVLIATDAPERAYGVLGLTQELEDVLPAAPPCYIQTVLLPWRGQIIYDGLVSSYPLSFGGGARRGLAGAYNRIKAGPGIIVSLEPGAATERTEPPGPKAAVGEARMQKLLKELPATVAEVEAAHGPPREHLRGPAAAAHAVFRPDGKSLLELDEVLVYRNVLRGVVLEVYGYRGKVAGVHVAVKWWR